MDPESFVRVSVTVFFSHQLILQRREGLRISITKSGHQSAHQQNVIYSLADRWWTNIESWLGSLGFFRESGPVFLLKETYSFVIFHGGGLSGSGPLPTPWYTYVTACGDPESFGQRGSNLDILCSLVRRRRIQIPLLAGHQRPASETPFKWRFAGGPMMAQH